MDSTQRCPATRPLGQLQHPDFPLESAANWKARHLTRILSHLPVQEPCDKSWALNHGEPTQQASSDTVGGPEESWPILA